jgi:hypothetical protein
MGEHTSAQFDITNGTPQGLPLSPLLSTLYTAQLLKIANTWTHRDLSIYVDDGAIFATSATTKAATTSTLEGFNVALKWLHTNSLDVDLSKCKLMIFHKTRKCANLLGGEITEVRYLDSALGPNTIKTTKSLKYLGIYINHRLCWTKHVEIMTNRGKSNIHGINILGNSIQGLDFLNWRKVFNTLVIPSMTYGVQVWYTGTKQKGLIQKI